MRLERHASAGVSGAGIPSAPCSPCFPTPISTSWLSSQPTPNSEESNITSSQQTQSTGTYTVGNNVLTLVRNGATEQHMIFPVAGGSLNIDGMVYKKR
jgi:hypothetical protein